MTEFFDSIGSVNSLVILPLRQAINHMPCQLVALILEILNIHKLDVGPRLRAHNLTSDIDLNHSIHPFRAKLVKKCLCLLH